MKLLLLIVSASSILFFGCGPTAEEKEAMEKAKMDSVARAAQQELLQKQADSVAKEEAMRRSLDSLYDTKATEMSEEEKEEALRRQMDSLFDAASNKMNKKR